MNKKDNIEELFNRFEGDFNNENTPAKHQMRFLEKLEAQEKASEQKRKKNWWKPLSIAASIILLVALGFNNANSESEAQGLASVSPEMEETQSFFETTISQELETLKGFENEETEILIKDTFSRLEALEIEYEQLKLDLEESGNDKRVISAMINNFQSRIDILQQVITTIEEIKTLKANRNETTI